MRVVCKIGKTQELTGMVMVIKRAIISNLENRKEVQEPNGIQKANKQSTEHNVNLTCHKYH